MRKMLMALLAMFLMAGLVVAVEVSLVADGYDKTKKELKVKLTDTVEPGDTVIVAERFF